jgi:uncharacterized membrane protein YbhN (UPF0104 family)
MDTSSPAPGAAPHRPGGGIWHHLSGRSRLGRALRWGFAIAAIGAAVRLLAVDFDWAALGRALAGADLRLWLAAVLAFHVSVAARAWRWRGLLATARAPASLGATYAALVMAWGLNCILPARVGDAYRPILLRRWSAATISAGLGTVAIERVIDLAAVVAGGLLAGWAALGSDLPPALIVAGLVIVGLVTAFVVALVWFRRPLGHLARRLPLPLEVHEVVAGFGAGLVAVDRRSVVPRLAETVVVWGSEVVRTALVLAALGLLGAPFGVGAVVFVALSASLLSAVPISPAGLGLVEAGLLGVLHGLFGLALPLAAAVVILERVISVGTLLLAAGLTWLVTGLSPGVAAASR